MEQDVDAARDRANRPKEPNAKRAPVHGQGAIAALGDPRLPTRLIPLLQGAVPAKVGDPRVKIGRASCRERV